MENNPNIYENEEEVQFLPLLKRCFYLFLRNWYWFALSVVLCVGLGWYYQQRSPQIYQRQTVMLIEDADVSSMGSGMRRAARNSNMSTLLELNGVSVGDNLQNEIFILASNRLMQRVVDKLHLDVDYTTEEDLHPIALYGKERPFEILFQKKFKGKNGQGITVVKKDANTVILKDMVDKEGEKVADVEARFGQMVQTPYGPLCVVRGKTFARWADEEIHVTRLSCDKAAERFLGNFSATEYDKETSLIVLTCKDVNVKRADDILNTLYDTYKEDVVENKNRVALNTAKFIDERIQLIGRELTSVESELASFKKRNQILDFSETSKTVLSETSTARQQTLQIETQLNVAKYLDEYLHSDNNAHDLIPALNIGEQGFNTQITAFNTLMNQRNNMAANSSESQGVVREMDRQLQQMRQAISASLSSYVASLELRLRDAKANEELLTGRIAGAPDQEKQGLDIKRQQMLKEALYTYLLNKREEVALQQAINEANVRIVEGPIGGDNKVSPRTSIILLGSFFIGFFIPAFIIWVRIASDVSVHGRKDVEDATTIPILGEVPRLKNADDTTILTNLPSDAPIVEAFRILRFNIGYMRHDTQVMLFTSSTPGQGKSFTSRNFATILAMAGKRVLLIDADIRRRTLSRHFGHKFGLTTYLADEHSQLSDIIKFEGITKGVDFMPAGPTPPNPSELLMSDRLEKLVEELRQQYDYILFDATPMFSVADASIVDRVADMTVFIIRAGMQNRDFLPDLERMHKDNRFRNLCLIINDSDVKHSKYGFGYGYGYGYGYGQSSGAKDRGLRAKNILNRLRH